jgi:hypothetical protein
MRRLPQTLCVKLEKGTGGGDDYFVVDTDLAGMVEMGEKVQVGVYRLVETKTVSGVAEVSNKRTIPK